MKLFLSCVSDEFGLYREPLRRELALPDVAVTIQEDLNPQGDDTLAMLEDYIASCAAVVHIVGDMAGAAPPDSCVNALLQRHPDLKKKLPPLAAALDERKAISYTQWEAWLSLYLDKIMLVVTPSATAPRSPKLNSTEASKAAQAQHLKRLEAIDRFPDKQPFTNELHLAQSRSSARPSIPR